MRIERRTGRAHRFEEHLNRVAEMKEKPRTIAGSGTSDGKVLARLKMGKQIKLMITNATPSSIASRFSRAELVSLTLEMRAFRSV